MCRFFFFAEDIRIILNKIQLGKMKYLGRKLLEMLLSEVSRAANPGMPFIFCHCSSVKTVSNVNINAYLVYEQEIAINKY